MCVARFPRVACPEQARLSQRDNRYLASTEVVAALTGALETD